MTAIRDDDAFIAELLARKGVTPAPGRPPFWGADQALVGRFDPARAEMLEHFDRPVDQRTREPDAWHLDEELYLLFSRGAGREPAAWLVGIGQCYTPWAARVEGDPILGHAVVPVSTAEAIDWARRRLSPDDAAAVKERLTFEDDAHFHRLIAPLSAPVDVTGR